MSMFVVKDRHRTSRRRLGGVASPVRRRSWVSHLGFGLITGIGLGAAARGFMRLLTEDPEFTWSGTLFIIGLFTVFGVAQGAVAAVRSRTTRRWITVPARLVGGLSYLMLGGGPGVLLLPFLWFGALAFWRTGWSRWIRASLAVLAFADLLAVVVITLSEEGFDRLFEPAVAAGFALLAVTYVATAWTVGPTIRPPSIGAAPIGVPLSESAGRPTALARSASAAVGS